MNTIHKMEPPQNFTLTMMAMNKGILMLQHRRSADVLKDLNIYNYL